MPPLQRFVVALAGGLQDSKAQPDPGDFVRLHNFALFRGRFGLRAPVKEIATIGSDSQILDIKAYRDKVWILGWDGSDEVTLYNMDWPGPTADWGTPSVKGVIHTGVTSKPLIRMTPFSGGLEDEPKDRIYIADYNQVEPTKIFQVTSPEATSILKVDFDADPLPVPTAEDVYFSLMIPYQFHLWGTGFYGGTGDFRPEMLRFSQPGLIPNIDPAGGVDFEDNTPASKEWFSFGYRNLGRRGDKIKALSFATGNMMVFQAGSAHALFGYGQDSWAAKQVSDQIGCVGPNAAVQAGAGGMCLFWSHDGPFATDGTQVMSIGEDIKQHVIDLGATDNVSAAYSPDDGVVYFSLVEPLADKDSTDLWPTTYLAYDVEKKRWAEGSWLAGNVTGDPFALQVAVLSTITARDIAAAPGPRDKPQNVVATAYSDKFIQIKWDPGDTATETRTMIHRSTSPTFTPDDTTLIATLDSDYGTTYNDKTGLTEVVTYFYQLQHYRNGTYSASSTETSARTWCAPPVSVTLQPIPDGIRVTVDVLHNLSNVQIWRSPVVGLGHVDTMLAHDPTTPQGVGDYVFDDNGSNITCGIEYHYFVKIHDINDSGGEHPSLAYPDEVNLGEKLRAIACAGEDTTAFAVAAGGNYLRVTQPGKVLYTATCFYTRANVESDMIKMYVDKGGGAGYVGPWKFPCKRAFGAVKFSFTAYCPSQSAMWTVKWESLQNGTKVLNTVYNDAINPCTGAAV